MIILSVDYGDVRTGIAVCDRMEFLASPVGVINQSYEPKLIKEIAEIAKTKKAELIVVGLPKNMDGSEGERAEKCKAFALRLSEETGIVTEMQDERLTTVSAHRALSDNNVRGQKRKNVVDAVSAVMILEDFLRKRK
ncbi:MAG: Holliday junction resolvase RuvX [Acutalibacteraceae bacterium]|nr:Holliday junction resolvase RuvX [Acutalibacteraceae bacterium]